MDSIPRTSGVYKIVCSPTKKVYIGSSQNLHKRHQDHFAMLRKGTHNNAYLQRAYTKHGDDSFLFEVIELVLSPFLADREQVWINRFKAANPKYGYNLRPIADSNIGIKTSPETRAKLRVFNKNKWKNPEFREKMAALRSDPEYRRKWLEAKRIAAAKIVWTPEMRAAHGARGKGRVYTLEVRQKISAAHKAKWQDPAYRAKMTELRSDPEYRAKQRAVWDDPEYRAMQSATHKGKKQSPETIAKLIIIRTGQKRSEETKARMSAAQKGLKKRPQTTKTREQCRARMKAKWQDPEYRALMMVNRRKKK
jgi:group I intron endonuclease